MTKIEKVLEKVHKLLALAQSPNENEAAAAAEKAQAILAEYNLSMGDVKSEKDEAMVIDSEMYSETIYRPWRRTIGASVAMLYFCSYFYSTTNGVKTKYRDYHNFVGQKHNVAVAKLMFGYLMAAVERLAKEGSKTVPASERTAYMISFMNRASVALSLRIQQRIKAAKAGEIKTEAGTNLPALANLYDQANRDLQSFLSAAKPDLRAKNTRFALNHGKGSADGHAAGNSIGLDAQVGGSKGSGYMIAGK